MSEVSLILGPVAFRDFEIPASIRFGGEQRLSVHRLLGGARVIDALGRDDADISFSGIFSGDGATLRARTLDALRTEGASLPLTWDVFFYTVVIRSFEADYRSGWWIPFRIVCTVVRDEAASFTEAATSLAALVLSDLGSAVEQAFGGGLDLSSIGSALSDADATKQGTSSFAQAQSAVENGRSSLTSTMGTAETSLADASADLTTARSAQEGVAALNGATESAGKLGALSSARGYLGRVAANLKHAGG